MLEEELDRLYGLPPGEFTAARDELAKRLRGEDRREEAEQVKQLRKPPVAAWLVNRLARERELEVQRLAKVGETLAQTQAALESEEFTRAREEEHRVLGRLAQAARELAAREGVGDAAVTKATETMRAASLTAEGRDLLKRGRLTEELQPPGFEALAGFPAPARRRPKAKAAPSKRKQAEREQARELVKRLRAEERELAKAAQTARQAADKAEAAAAKATSEREAAESSLERLS